MPIDAKYWSTIVLVVVVSSLTKVIFESIKISIIKHGARKIAPIALTIALVLLTSTALLRTILSGLTSVELWLFSVAWVIFAILFTIGPHPAPNWSIVSLVVVTAATLYLLQGHMFNRVISVVEDLQDEVWYLHDQIPDSR